LGNLSRFGPEGRILYAKSLTLGLVVAALIALGQALFLATCVRSSREDAKVRMLVWFPLCAGASDWIENIGIALMILLFPGTNSVVAVLTRTATIVKLALQQTTLILSAGASTWAIWRYARSRRLAA
jgi:hypothetical protein